MAIPILIKWPLTILAAGYFASQCRKPSGPLGRLVVGMMNHSHASLTQWAFEHVELSDHGAALDIGCGGGRTIQRLAAIVAHGKVYGIDYSAASVAASRRLNRAAIESGQVDVQQASVQQLPFPDATFDLATAIETHYYWPDRPAAFREISRVLKPGGQLLIVAEAYRAGSGRGAIEAVALKLIGGEALTVDQHRELFTQAGFTAVDVVTQPSKGWLCAVGRKPLS